jgi:hypothetical protein
MKSKDFSVLKISNFGYSMLIVVGLVLLTLSACSDTDAGCPVPTGTPQYLSLPPEDLPYSSFDPSSIPFTREISGKQISFTTFLEGPLCNASWEGTVYVSCDVQVYPWVESPTFLQECDFKVEPDAIIYVAYHNDTAFYKGCSCHTGEIIEP